MSNSNLIITALIGGLIGFGASFAYFEPKHKSLTDEINLRPPVLVVDMTKLAVDSVPVGSGKAAMNEHFRQTQAVIDKFKEAGFLVIPRENIISSPSDLMLDAADLPPNKHISGGD